MFVYVVKFYNCYQLEAEIIEQKLTSANEGHRYVFSINLSFFLLSDKHIFIITFVEAYFFLTQRDKQFEYCLLK